MYDTHDARFWQGFIMVVTFLGLVAPAVLARGFILEQVRPFSCLTNRVAVYP